MSQDNPDSIPKISTVLLNWNREHLLKKALESYVSTITVPHELIIIDNGSQDGSVDFIKKFCQDNPKISAFLLNENLSGNAINLGLSLAHGEFLHVSENDLEYLPGWDTTLLKKFETFSKLGQISLFSYKPQTEIGEIWETHPATPLTKDGQTIFLAEKNVTTSCIFRREIWEKGARWKPNPHVTGNSKTPSDYFFSLEVLKLGYLVAWNDKYTVINWGHNVNEWRYKLDYYLRNYKAKSWLGLEGMKKRLKENGYDLIEKEGKYEIIQI